MTIEWYREHGFEVSANFSQAVIDRLEGRLTRAYVLPIVPAADLEDALIQECLADLVYYALCLENAKVTRKGAKGKSDENSYSLIADQITVERAAACLALTRLQALPGATHNDPDDVLDLLFHTCYFGKKVSKV